MSLKGRGQGVDLGTSTRSLIRSIFFSFLGLEFPYDPLNLLPFLVFLSPRPHTIGTPTPDPDIDDDDDDVRELEGGRGVTITRRASAPHHCIIAIFFALKASHFTVVVAQNSKTHYNSSTLCENETVGVVLWAGLGLSLFYYFLLLIPKAQTQFSIN